MTKRLLTVCFSVMLISVTSFEDAHALLYEATGSFGFDYTKSGKINNLAENLHTSVDIAGFDHSLGILNSVSIEISGGAAWHTYVNSFQQEENSKKRFTHNAWNTFDLTRNLSAGNEVFIDETYEIETAIFWDDTSSNVTWDPGGPVVSWPWLITETDIDASDYFLRFGDNDVSYAAQTNGVMNSGGSTLDSAFFHTDWSMNITHIYDYTPMPEPAGILLFSTGLVVLLGVKRRTYRV